MEEFTCIYQLLSKIVIHHMEGQGDCSVCVPDKMNEKCTGFRPIVTETGETKDGQPQAQT